MSNLTQPDNREPLRGGWATTTSGMVHWVVPHSYLGWSQAICSRTLSRPRDGAEASKPYCKTCVKRVDEATANGR